jgi:flagellar hook-basal body protein
MADGSRRVLGQIPLYNFANPQGLEAVGGGLYSASASSGPAVPGTPGTGALGELIGGFLEGSNVDLGTEMTDMLIDRLDVRVNAASIRAQNDMLGELLDLKG